MAAQKVDVDVSVIKTFALPKLIYPFTVLLGGLKRSNTKIKFRNISFIWDSKPNIIKRATLYRDYKNGGFRIINLEKDLTH